MIDYRKTDQIMFGGDYNPEQWPEETWPDDMRLLKNICNEFLIYYNQLDLTELDYNKMLAIITYKNLFPRDFSDLQLNKGFVYALFENIHIHEKISLSHYRFGNYVFGIWWKFICYRRKCYTRRQNRRSLNHRPYTQNNLCSSLAIGVYRWNVIG